MRHFPSAAWSLLVLCVGGSSVLAVETTPVPAVTAPAATAPATYGPSHWLSTAGWKSGPAEHGNPAKVSVVPAAEGAADSRAIEVVFTGGTKDKAVILHPVTKEDGAPKPTISFAVLNPSDQTVQIAIAIKTGKAWVYHESTAQVIPPQTKESIALSFDLEASVYKTAASKWQPTSAIADLAELREVQVVILNGSVTGAVTIVDVQIRERQ